MKIDIDPRWCGQPKQGYIYTYIPKEYFEFDKLNAFLIDPPLLVPDEMDFTDIATYMVPRVPKPGQRYVEVQDHLGQLVPCALDYFGDPIWDILDTVGKSNYTVVKYLEEVRRQGFHQLVPRTLDFSKISPESKYLVMHSEAIVYTNGDFPVEYCPTKSHHEPCIGSAWLTDRDPVGRTATGEVFEARARKGDEQYARGIFAAFPIGAIGNFRVYEDLGPEKMHEKALKALEGLGERLAAPVFIQLEE